MKESILKTQGVSFPRSGHGPLYKFLRLYFGGQLRYCAAGQQQSCNCNSVPCKSAETNYSKSHDVGLMVGRGLTMRSDYQYLIQYRNPVRSIVSDYSLYLHQHPTHTDKNHWEQFALARIQYWNRFVDKWLIKNRQRHDCLRCSYEALVRNPADTVTRIIEFMSVAPLRLPARDRALERTKFRPRKKLEKFKHYDELFFDKLESVAYPRLHTLGIPTHILSV